jgi:RepB DNA-primase from phage plasmid
VFDRGFFLTLHAMRRQLAAMPNELYVIRLIHNRTRRPCPGERLWTAGQLLHGSVVRFLRARNCQGFDVYLWPYADEGNAGYVLLDLDHVQPDLLTRMSANGHDPCAVLQTSPGHLQAWIHVSSSPLKPALATAIAKLLAHTYAGDRASTDWHHLGRLAGFTNQKPERRTARLYPPWVKVLETRAGLASAAQELLQAAAPPVPPVLPSCPEPTARSLGAAITAQGAISIYQRWIRRWHIRERFSSPDWSIVDLWLARKLLAQRIPPTQVEAILRLGSPNFPRHHSDPEDYLRRTLAYAGFPSTPRPVCLSHAAAPALPAGRDRRESDSSNSAGGR